jgi:hypothetical protein
MFGFPFSLRSKSMPRCSRMTIPLCGLSLCPLYGECFRIIRSSKHRRGVREKGVRGCVDCLLISHPKPECTNQAQTEPPARTSPSCHESQREKGRALGQMGLVLSNPIASPSRRGRNTTFVARFHKDLDQAIRTASLTMLQAQSLQSSMRRRA